MPVRRARRVLADGDAAGQGTIDPAWLRRWTIRTRIGALAVLTVIVVAAVAGVALNTIGGVDQQARRVNRLLDARRLNEQVISALRDVHDASVAAGAHPTSTSAAPKGDLDGLVRDATVLPPKVTERLLPQSLDADRVAISADARELDEAESVLGGGDSATAMAHDVKQEKESFNEAVRARHHLDSAISQLQRSAQSHVAAVRTRGTVTLFLVAILGLAVLLFAAQLVADSISSPLRVLGRAMRRFGDGDLRSRGAEAPDEVGVLARSFNTTASVTAERVRDLRADAESGSQLRIIAEALDLALDESDVHRIVEHAMGIIAPGRPVELLVNQAGSSTLHRVASNPNGGAPSCPVEDTSGCAAIRRARTQTFDSPDAINSCPMLRGRPSGPCSAVCVPINAGGTLVGVVHSTGEVGAPPPPATADQLMTLASQAGARMASMRTLDASRVEASTDGLTGVANRRMLATTLGDLLRTSTPFVLVVADLDRFKDLNDTYGHETGDRALQLFAEVLSSNVRGRDLVARFGGEEFVLVYPEMNVQTGMEVLERIRSALADAISIAAIPSFTASFGFTHSSSGVDVDSIIRIADAGLLMAKDLGRDRVVYADADLAAEIFAGRRDGA
jgi:diguanylate cyclase (GGDEF)-like protein